MEEREIRRGDIYYADLSPVVGSEQGGIRPVLVIQNNTGNAYSPTVIVAAVTSKPKTKLPTSWIVGIPFAFKSWVRYSPIPTILVLGSPGIESANSSWEWV